MLKAQLANRAAVGKANNHVPETIRNIRMIHNFHKEKYMESKYDGYILKSYRAMEKSNFYDAIYSPIILVVSAVIVAVMMILSAMGGEMQSFFGMSVGTAVAVIAYVGKVFEPLESIGMEIQNIQSAVAGVHRINEFLDEPERGEADRSIRCRQLLQSNMPCIELNHVRFGYNKNEPVLNGRSFTVKQGESVTLTGRTGAGKSTISSLFWDCTAPTAAAFVFSVCKQAVFPTGKSEPYLDTLNRPFEWFREQLQSRSHCLIHLFPGRMPKSRTDCRLA